MNSAAIPFLTTTLDVRWLSVTDANRYGLGYGYFGSESLPYFRCTPSVAAWFNRKMKIAIDRSDDGDQELGTALLESGSLDRYWEIANWADVAYGADVVTAAMPELPRAEPIPPDDVPPVDPHVWGGAFDGVKVNRSADIGGTVVISVPVAKAKRERAREKARAVSLFGDA